MSFDYRLATFVADIKAHGGTKEQNENLASTLNGLKGLGAMFAAQEPVAAEALNGVEISSGADYTRISISLSQETLDKLSKLAQSKAGDFMKAGKGESTEEKK
jgi:urocanate hydratase